MSYPISGLVKNFISPNYDPHKPLVVCYNTIIIIIIISSSSSSNFIIMLLKYY